MAKELRVEIVGNARSYQNALRAAGSATTGFGSTVGRVAKTAALAAGGAGIGALAITLRAGVKEWEEHAKVAAQTAQVLKSTGKVAGVSQKQVEDLATAIMRKTGIDDEAIQSSENLLLSFTRVRNEAGKGNDIFNRATKVITDYSVRTGKSATQATMLFGKALQEVAIGKIPTSIRGLGKLSDAQVKQMKAMVAAGDVAGAQGVILSMLEQRYGGAAEAAGNTLPGKLNILKESFRNMSAELLQSVAPALTQFADWTTQHMPQIEATFRTAFQGISAAVQFAAGIIRDYLIPAGEATVGWFQQHWPEIERITVDTFNRIAPVVVNAFNTIKSIITETVTTIQQIWARWGTQITAVTVATFTYLKSTIQGALNVIRGIVNIFGGLLHGDWSRVWLGLQQLFGGIMSQIVATLKLYGTLLVNALKVAGQLMLQAVTAPWNAIKSLAVSTFNSVVTTIRNSVSTAINNAKAVGVGILKGVSDGLTGLVKMVQSWFQTLWAWIKGAAGSAYAFARKIGTEIVRGVISGITGLAKSLGEKLYNEAKSGLGWVAGKLGIGSPSKVAAAMIGVPIAQGIVKGATDAIRVLGPTLSRSITQSLGTVKAAAVKGMGTVAQMIVAAAKKAGVDARAALAVAMSEGGTKFGAVGDNGHAFGPFQLNNAGGVVTGMSASQASAFANSLQGITYALNAMAKAGAAGKTGFDAISAIVRNFERPADPSGEIRRAIAYYKQLPAEVGGAAASVAAQSKTTVSAVLTGLANLVKQYAPIIGKEHALGIIRGLVQGTPTLVQQARTQMQQAAAAARQAIVDAQANFRSAFETMATNALAAFDAKMQQWVPPTQRLLDKMNFADQLKQITDGLAEAMGQLSGGGAVAAAEAGAKIGSSITDSINKAMAQIGGAKTFAALNKAALDAQNTVTAAIDKAAADSLAKAQSDVTTAQQQLQAAQATGDPEAIAAAQQALDTAVANQNALNAAVLQAKQQALAPLVAQEQATHDAIAAKQREGLAKQLSELETELAKHPEKWKTMANSVQTILAGYNVRLVSAGKAWASKFGEGIIAGIPAAVAAAKQLAAAVDAYLPHSPAEKGPLSVDPAKGGKWLGRQLAAGVSGVGVGNIIGKIAPAPTAGSFAMGTGGITVNVYNAGSVISENELQTSIYRALERRNSRNPSILRANPLTA